MVTNFYEYERDLCVNCLIPLLKRQGIELAGKSVLDVGCGYGGFLTALREQFALKEPLGVDLDAEMIRIGREKCPRDIRLEHGDFFQMDPGNFDFILMRDVLEHVVDVGGALERAAARLLPGGSIYASFAPFFSPFGGHQHNGEGFFSNVPWLQFLPESWFRRLLLLHGNSYKSGRELELDIESVLRTRLTLGGFRSKLPKAGLRLKYSAQYVVRPDYRIKFGLPTLVFPAVPLIEELVCTGAEALLERTQR
jgi:ubiquinone/menaquinone biosynthesis C-methylase UbiE